MLEQQHDLVTRLGVEVAGGFVGQHHQRPIHERSRDRDPLLFAAGQFAGQPVGFTAQPHQLQDLGHGPIDELAAFTDHFQRERHVLGDGPLLQQPEVLEHTAHPLAQPGDPPSGQPVHPEVRDVDLAAGRDLLFDEHPHEGRFAGAGGADEEDELTLADMDGNVLQCGSRRGRIRLADVAQGDHEESV